MNPDTGAIARFENQQDAEQAGFNIPLTDGEAKKLLPMNRHERRKWVSQSRKKNKRG